MALIVLVIYRFLKPHIPENTVGWLISGGLCAVAGAAVYFAVCYAIGVEEVRSVIGGFIKKMKGKA